jgi:hypothetical protein
VVIISFLVRKTPMATAPITLNIQQPTTNLQGNPITLNITPVPEQIRTVNGLQPYQTAEVAGIITSLNFPQRRGDPTTFRINCPNMGRTFDAVCDLFCPIRQGDTIYALCMIGPDGKLHVSRPPFVQPAIDRDSMIQCFMRSLKQGYYPANKIYTTVSKIAGGDEAVIPFLTGIAQSWNDTHNAEILFMFDGIDSDDVKKLLSWWHRERNLRRLYPFGLTKKEINACRMTCDDIYQRCMVNPYTVPAIPIDKCDGIMDRLNKRPGQPERIRGAIIRVLWKNLHESGWTGTPTRFLSRQFPGIKEHVESLKTEYDMVAEMETAYLKFPHKVETYIAEYIADKRTNDLINYDTPIDEVVTHPNGKMVERLSAHFTRDLSEDQQRAVQGALDHSLCIITGGAGTGKCQKLGTKVLMFDGQIKVVENLKVGDLLMGPDSKPRTVLSKCFGIDNMFEIKPSKGRSFVCNTPHVLTLKGFEPYLGIRNDREKCYIATYSEKGYRKRKAFLTQDEAQTFIDDLSEDIFDIPLNEYMLRSDNDKRYCYSFHVGVDFPDKEVPIDPYMIGFWLGDGTSRAPEITTIDKEVIDYFDVGISAMGLHFNKRDDYHYTITSIGKRCGSTGCNKFLNTLRDLNMLDNKHIPDVYKINSREVRMKLLAGLIDSDGYQGNNCIEITQKNKRLADDIEYLAFSLGFMVTRVECEKGCEYKGEMRYGIYQRMSIFGEGLEEIPVILERKKCYKRQIVRRATCQRFEVIPQGKGIYCGFELTGDGRYLLADFLVTHNTTCIGQIVHNLELRGINYAICSFTGKAVARIREVTKKRNPATMHRLISNTRKNQLDKRSTQFEKDIPLMEYEHVIIDEVSMVTTELLYDFVQAYPNIQRLTLVGDVNQLPPIGWGSLFQQILKSETVPTYKLTTNYRVYTTDGERDGVILNANAIVTHDPVYPFEFVSTTNFSIIEGPIERVYDIIRGCFASGIKRDQIVIISPFNRYLDTLNRTFQEIYDEGARRVTDSRGVRWMIGDRVMLTENDQEIGVYNGESGTIRDITNTAILVDFGQSGSHEFLLEPTHDGRANYPQGTTNQYYRRGRAMDDAMDGDEGDFDDERTVKRLLHAYALTVDKSQGSEWDFVIFFIPEFNTGSFLNKNRIYTGLTRTKRACWLVVSDTDALNIAAVKTPQFRCENLGKRLAAKLPNLKPFTIARPHMTEMLNDLPIMPEDIIPADAYDMGFDCDDFD